MGKIVFRCAAAFLNATAKKKKETKSLSHQKKKKEIDPFILFSSFVLLVYGTNLYTAIIIIVKQKRENTKQQKSKAQIALNRTRGNRVTMCASKITERHQRIRKMRKKKRRDCLPLH